MEHGQGSMSAANAGVQFIYARLTGTPGTAGALVSDRVYDRHAVPQDVEYPYIEIRPVLQVNSLPRNTHKTMGDYLIGRTKRYVVTAIARSHSLADVEAIRDAIESDLHKASGTVSRGDVLYCSHYADHENTYRDGDTQFVEQGGIYEVRTD